MSSPRGGFLSNALSYGANAVSMVGETLGAFSKPVAKSEFLDIGEVLTGLALLVFRDPKTKISVYQHEIHRDHYYPIFNLQGGKRFIYGGSHEELHNLTAPLFYAVLWLDPSNNEKIRIVFELAKQGLEQLIEYAYENDYQTRQYLHSVHLRILKESLEGYEVNRNDYLIPDWESNPLACASRDFWTAEDSPLETICDLLQKALTRKEKDMDFKHQIEAVKEETRVANEKIKALFEKIKAGK